jgi:hypothetical protein
MFERECGVRFSTPISENDLLSPVARGLNKAHTGQRSRSPCHRRARSSRRCMDRTRRLRSPLSMAHETLQFDAVGGFIASNFFE